MGDTWLAGWEAWELCQYQYDKSTSALTSNVAVTGDRGKLNRLAGKTIAQVPYGLALQARRNQTGRMNIAYGSQIKSPISSKAAQASGRQGKQPSCRRKEGCSAASKCVKLNAPRS
jgi:hypothetical protein